MPNYRLTIILSGAVSLGAYEAGVVSQIAYAVTAWNHNAADKGKIIIDIVSGASAGAMTGAMLSKYLMYQASDMPSAATFVRGSFDCWCGVETSIANLVQMQPNDIHSFLSSTAIDNLGARFINSPGVGIVPCQDELIFTCTLTSLDRIPLDIQPTDSIPQNTTINGVTYHDWVTFAFDGQSNDPVQLSDTQQIAAGRRTTWDHLRRCAITSGSIPVAWQPTRISRLGSDFDPPIAGGGEVVFRYADGGILNNMPLNRASEAIANLNNGGSDLNRVYVLIIPDPATPNAPLNNILPDQRDTNTTVAQALGCVARAYQEQSFYRDLDQAQDINKRLDARDEMIPGIARQVTYVPLASLTQEITNATTELTAVLAKVAPGQTAASVIASYASDPDGYVKAFATLGTEQKELAYILLAIYDNVADLYGRNRVTIGLITPEPRIVLAGYLLGHFGAMVNPPLMQHDFCYGLENAFDWLQTLAAKVGVSDPASVLDDVEAKRSGIGGGESPWDGLNIDDIMPIDRCVSPWTTVDPHVERHFITDVIDRGADLLIAEEGIDLLGTAVIHGTSKIVELVTSFPPTPPNPVPCP